MAPSLLIVTPGPPASMHARHDVARECLEARTHRMELQHQAIDADFL
jgi:hypothetical protein